MIVSFIIPFYGSVSLLKRCLESLVAQTDGDFEAIVVDDASPEDGEALTRSFGERFRYVRQPANMSAFQARNRGALEAKGDYVVPVDPDDYVLPKLVAELRCQVEATDPDIVIFNVEQDTAGVITPHWCHYAPGRYTPEQVLDKMVRKELQWNVWAKAIRRTVWADLVSTQRFGEGIYMNVSEDFCIAIPLVLKSRTVDVIDYTGYRYWQNEQSVCHGVTGPKAWRAIRDTLMARRLALQFAAHENYSARVVFCIRSIARTVVTWWAHEWIAGMKETVRKRGRKL